MNRGLTCHDLLLLGADPGELLGPHPTAAQVTAMKSTQQRLDALTGLIKAQIGHGAKSGDAAHGFKGTG